MHREYYGSNRKQIAQHQKNRSCFSPNRNDRCHLVLGEHTITCLRPRDYTLVRTTWRYRPSIIFFTKLTLLIAKILLLLLLRNAQTLTRGANRCCVEFKILLLFRCYITLKCCVQSVSVDRLIELDCNSAWPTWCLLITQLVLSVGNIHRIGQETGLLLRSSVPPPGRHSSADTAVE